MSSRFIHVVACDRISFLVKAELYFIIYITFFFIHSCTKRLLNCFHLLLTVNSAVMKRGMQIPLQDLGFNYFGYISRSKSGIWGHIVILCLTFWGTSKCLFTTNESFYILIRIVQLCYSLCILANIFPFCSCSGYKVIPDIDKWNRK